MNEHLLIMGLRALGLENTRRDWEKGIVDGNLLLWEHSRSLGRLPRCWCYRSMYRANCMPRIRHSRSLSIYHSNIRFIIDVSRKSLAGIDNHPRLWLALRRPASGLAKEFQIQDQADPPMWTDRVPSRQLPESLFACSTHGPTYPGTTYVAYISPTFLIHNEWLRYSPDPDRFAGRQTTLL